MNKVTNIKVKKTKPVKGRKNVEKRLIDSVLLRHTFLNEILNEVH